MLFSKLVNNTFVCFRGVDHPSGSAPVRNTSIPAHS